MSNSIDLSGTTVPGLTIYKLSSGASATASYVRGAAIPYAASQILGAAPATVVTLTFDLTGYTNNTQIELVFAAATVTGASGLLKLDDNLNKIPGEATDDHVSYQNVGGATTLTGVQENPQATISMGVPAGNFVTTVGGTTLIYTITDSSGTGGINVSSSNFFDPTNSKIQRFDYATKAWVDLTGTVTGTLPTITITLPASVAGTYYRSVITDQTLIKETAATNGYTHSMAYGPTKTSISAPWIPAAGAAAYTDAAGYINQAFATSSVASFALAAGRLCQARLHGPGHGRHRSRVRNGRQPQAFLRQQDSHRSRWHLVPARVDFQRRDFFPADIPE